MSNFSNLTRANSVYSPVRTADIDEIENRPSSPEKPASFKGHAMKSVAPAPKEALQPHQVVARHMDTVKNLAGKIKELTIDKEHKKDMLQRLNGHFSNLSSIKESLHTEKDPAKLVNSASALAKQAERIGQEADTAEKLAPVGNRPRAYGIDEMENE